MHILAEPTRSLDDTAIAVDLNQTPADILFLSFSDSDLTLAANAYQASTEYPSLRLANLSALRHPYSVDLYLEKVARNARFVLVRCLGGLDYWRYGLEELAASARRHGFKLAVLPGDDQEDPRLNALSTLDIADLRRLWLWFQMGGSDNLSSLFGWIATSLGRPMPWQDPAPLPAFGIWKSAAPQRPQAHALIIFYRAYLLAADLAPIDALLNALVQKDFEAQAAFVTSLKDAAVKDPLTTLIHTSKPDVILNTTGFACRADGNSSVLDEADAPVLQAIMSTGFRTAWETSLRGLGPADLAMNVVLPEIDGRLIGPAISFKAKSARREPHEFTPVLHQPEEEAIARLASLASAWARLRKQPREQKKLALVLSDYPAKGGRTGYAVGLDGPESLKAITDDLRENGFDIGALPAAQDLIRQIEDGVYQIHLNLDDYQKEFATFPQVFRENIRAIWGDAKDDALLIDKRFTFKALISNKLILAVQPDRGRRSSRAGDYHDPNLPPGHHYVAFYLWLKRQGIDALIHLGTHGTLEWLPGKAAALSPHCAPAALVGEIPVLYPFIVNNPGEAAQAKRRLSAATISHMTPPLQKAGTHGAMEEIEHLLDEFSSAQMLDAPRAKTLAALILDKAQDNGLAADCGLTGLDQIAALAKLDAFMCDLKDMRINDGLHVFGRMPDTKRITQMAEAIGLAQEKLTALYQQSAKGEREALLAGLDGRFIAPGPAGAPTKARLDVLPTGRNLYAVDPRAVPTRTAWDIGQAHAEAIIARYVQDHGDWPKRIIIDLWGSATMRTGGDDLAQAFALLGVRPHWDNASTRISGFEIQSPARLGRPRVDVTLRISGLFRDVFQTQIALFDEAVKAVASLDEDEETNPLAASCGSLSPRIFGAASGVYGLGLSTKIATGDFKDRSDLGAHYIQTSGYAYSDKADGIMAMQTFAEKIRDADIFVHAQDMSGQDILDADAFAEHEGGFTAAALSLNANPAIYHVDATGETAKVHTLEEEIARVLRGRAINPRWLESQMNHGHRGAAEIAETIHNFFSFAATTPAIKDHQFDLLFDATLGCDSVRDFMMNANPAAAIASARLFKAAIERGYWDTRRNSIAIRVADILGSSA